MCSDKPSWSVTKSATVAFSWRLFKRSFNFGRWCRASSFTLSDILLYLVWLAGSILRLQQFKIYSESYTKNSYTIWIYILSSSQTREMSPLLAKNGSPVQSNTFFFFSNKIPGHLARLASLDPVLDMWQHIDQKKQTNQNISMLTETKFRQVFLQLLLMIHFCE